jgi:mxaL protein
VRLSAVTVWRALRSPFEPGSRAISAALLLLLCGLLLPQVNLPRNTYSYVVVFDITQSMNVEDYDLNGLPVSRLAFAKEAVRRALRQLPCGSRIGWGAFAEYRTILLLAPVEVCANYNDLLASLDRIDGRMRWANASEVRKGVYWAMRAAKDSGGQPGMGPPDVVFLTDGQEAPPEVGPGLPMFDDLKRGEPHGWLLGVGGYTPRRIPRTDDDGKVIGYWRGDEVIQLSDLLSDGGSGASGAAGTPNTPGTSKGAAPVSHEELSEVREPHLQALAREVGFDYAHLTSLESVGAAMQDARFARRQSAPADVGWIPTLAALLMLAVRFRP